jgi:predicted ester cyclase
MEDFWRTGDGLRRALPAFRQTFSDIAIHIGDTVSDGDTIGYRMTFTGTHSGEFMGVPPTGKRIVMT